MFRIGHLGDSNDLTLLATLAGCEMGLKLSGVSLAASGAQAAMDFYVSHARANRVEEEGRVGTAPPPQCKVERFTARRGCGREMCVLKWSQSHPHARARVGSDFGRPIDSGDTP
jgi:hypothetical protein